MAEAKSDMAEAMIEELSKYVEACSNTNEEEQLKGVTAIRKLCSIEANPPLQQVINSGVVPVLIRHITRDENPKLQFEATWAITNIASGDSQQTNFVVDKGAANPLLHILNSPTCDTSVKDQAIWALGNIAGDSPKLRDLLLSLNIVPSLIEILQSQVKMSMLRNACWALSNCCRGKPVPPLEFVFPAIKVFSRIISEKPDTMVLTDALWGLSYLTDNQSEATRELLTFPNILATILEHTKSPQSTIVTPCIRILGNLATDADDIVDKLLDSGAAEVLRDLLLNINTKKSLLRELCWTFSNITAGTQPQIQKLIDLNVIEAIYKYASPQSDPDIAKEAIWAIANMSAGANVKQFRYLLETADKYLPSMIAALKNSNRFDVRVIAVILEFVENVLNAVITTYPTELQTFEPVIITDQLTSALEVLQLHPNASLADKALNLLGTYFDVDEDGDEENVAVPSSGSSFSFSVPSENKPVAEESGSSSSSVIPENPNPDNGGDDGDEGDDGGVGGNEFTF